MDEDNPPRGVVLILGGLYEPIGPDEFWHRPGIVEGLEAAGLQVIAIDHPAIPRSPDPLLARHCQRLCGGPEISGAPGDATRGNVAGA